MKEEVIFRMESAYREDFEVKSYHFGGPEKTMCIIGNMRGNEIQQLYIAGQMVRTLKRFEEEGLNAIVSHAVKASYRRTLELAGKDPDGI